MKKEIIEFGKQMDASPDKKEVADLVVKLNRTKVLDLGAGTGIISRLIAEQGIHATAVDNNFKSTDLQDSEYITYVNDDLIHYVDYLIDHGTKFDCIILSAVLHELPKKQYNHLKKVIHKITTDDCIIIIREPYYRKLHNYYTPFLSLEDQERAVEEIFNVTDTEFQKLFKTTKKVSGRHLPLPIEALSMAFTYSYGKDSWDREVNEYRFTFSYKELFKFIKAAYKYKHYVVVEEKFDTSYTKYFKKCGYSDNVLKSIDYTNCTLVVKPDCWIDEWPEPVAYDKEAEQEKPADKIHYELLLAFNGNCKINNKVYSDEELKKYANEYFYIGQKIKVNNNYDGFKNTYVGVLLELVEKPAGIYGKILILED